MPTLCLTQSEIDAHKFRVEASFEGQGLTRATATAEFDFVFTPQDREDLRWYLEDYLQHVADPAPKIAARIESRIAELGTELFQKLFQGNIDDRGLWTAVRPHLANTRIEVVTGATQTTALPWEFLREPEDETPIALRSRAFVRTPNKISKTTQLQESDSGPIRILLVICRPGGDDDIPFRSVASRLLRGLNESARQAFQLDVLRPPNYDRLKTVLHEAKKAGTPYHVVHFDGHGTYSDLDGSGQMRGYLVFENEAFQSNTEFIHGTLIGELLAATDVPVLVINACRSAHEEPPEAPISSNGSKPSTDVAHIEQRGFGSLAQEVVNAGVAGVVAMRYNVYVVTAAQLVADLYASLASGRSLGEAVTRGRQLLYDQPQREINYQARPLRDWIVPIVFEAGPVALFPETAEHSNVKIAAPETAALPTLGFPPELNNRPEVGFFGRDETLLAVDRAFDTHQIVLMHAFAGSGKTSTAVEFARWYKLTGGIKGPVLFTSFERYKPLAQVLNETIGTQFTDILKQWDINWLALTVEERREAALRVLNEVPVLWIWDNVESITGFPSKAHSSWNETDQQDLVSFVRDAQQTKAKFLLTSRRKEQDWLNDLPKRVAVPPMRMQELVQFARALAEKHNQPLIDIDDWMPLLRFTAGNPLTITVLVTQALREGLKTESEIQSFVDRLRTGETLIEDEATGGRDSLRAALSYSLLSAFTPAEQKQVALLHFFEGIVAASFLGSMGTEGTEWCLPEVTGLTRAQRIEFLDRCADLGFLTSLDRGVYSIHPVLPQYLTSLFRKHYAQSEERAARAFAGAVGWFASMMADSYLEGEARVMHWIELHYFNLISARKTAIASQLWKSSISCMRALKIYFSVRPTEALEWKTLVQELVPYFFISGSDDPISERREQWMFMMEFRIEIAGKEEDMDEARRLQEITLRYSREHAKSGPDDDDKQVWIKNLANDLVVGAQVQATPEKTIEYLKEALKLYETIDGPIGRMGLARCAEGLADTFLRIDNFDEAEQWCNYGLRRLGPEDGGSAGFLFAVLGRIHYEHFQFVASLTWGKDVENTGPDPRSYLPKARKALESALILIPEFRLEVRARTRTLLANTFTHLFQYEAAFKQFLQAISDYEELNEIESAMDTRLELAVMLVNADRFEDAKQYAQAAYNYARQNADWRYSEAEVLQIIEIIENQARKQK
jgi:tetratricopeptide (TPR) repeat protein